jgi:hypothetical protein
MVSHGYNCIVHYIDLRLVKRAAEFLCDFFNTDSKFKLVVGNDEENKRRNDAIKNNLFWIREAANHEIHAVAKADPGLVHFVSQYSMITLSTALFLPVRLITFNMTD